MKKYRPVKETIVIVRAYGLTPSRIEENLPMERNIRRERSTKGFPRTYKYTFAGAFNIAEKNILERYVENCHQPKKLLRIYERNSISGLQTLASSQN